MAKLGLQVRIPNFSSLFWAFFVVQDTQKLIWLTNLDLNYTQSLLIRNGGKFWLVEFLIFRLILYGLCFLFFSWFCIVVSYFFLDFLRSFLIFFKNFDTSHMYVVWGGKPYKMKKPMRWKTNYFSKSSNSPLSLYNYV